MAAFTLRYIKDYLQNKFYPYTHSDAVYTDDGENKTLTESLSEMNKKIEDATIHPQSDWNETDNTTYSFIKNKPASLPANGGNADTVDGKHANEFVGNEHLTSLESHKSLFDEKLSIDTANPLIKNITFDSSTGIITVTRLNNTTFTINIPKSLVFSSALFDDVTNEIVITWSDDSKTRIPVDGLIDVYTGSENDVIQITVNDENIISAVIKNGSVTRTLLSTDVQTDLSKAHIHSNESTINKFSEDSNGNVLFNGTSISTESGTTDYTGLTNKPQINNVELSGNKSLSDLGIEAIGSADSVLSNAKSYTDSVASSKVGIEHLTNHVKPDNKTIVVADDGTISSYRFYTIPIKQNGVDLNNSTYCYPGRYACMTNNVAATLLNCPTSKAFSMDVLYSAGNYGQSCTQIIRDYDTANAKTYMRSIYVSNDVKSFGEWGRIYTSFDPPTGIYEKIILNKETLSFVNKVCKITSADILASTIADVYFTADTINIAQEANIIVDTYDGYLELVAKNEPTGEIKASIILKNTN